MSKGKILVIGSYNVDLTANVKQFPKPGETVFGSEFGKGLGGKGANQAIAAARAGGTAAFAGRIGADTFGMEAIQKLQKEGINTDYLVTDSTTPTGTALIMVNEHGENQIVVVSGANYKVLPGDVENIADYDAFKWLLVQMELPYETVKRAVIVGKQAGCKVILNPAPAIQEIIELLPFVDVLTPNQSEAELLTGVRVESKTDAQKAAKVLLQYGVKNVIITMASAGVYFASRTEQGVSAEWVSAIRVEAVDTTGAGDCFNGALTAALSQGQGISEAIRFAVAAAALSVTKVGAGNSMPYRQEIEELLSNN